jgi:hypothetical protein
LVVVVPLIPTYVYIEFDELDVQTKVHVTFTTIELDVVLVSSPELCVTPVEPVDDDESVEPHTTSTSLDDDTD